MSFADIRAQVKRDTGAEPSAALRLSFERSLRRALHRLVDDCFLVAIGDGGPGDPLRYFIHPAFAAIIGDPALIRALEATIRDAGQARVRGN